MKRTNSIFHLTIYVPLEEMAKKRQKFESYMFEMKKKAIGYLQSMSKQQMAEEME